MRNFIRQHSLDSNNRSRLHRSMAITDHPRIRGQQQGTSTYRGTASETRANRLVRFGRTRWRAGQHRTTCYESPDRIQHDFCIPNIRCLSRFHRTCRRLGQDTPLLQPKINLVQESSASNCSARVEAWSNRRRQSSGGCHCLPLFLGSETSLALDQNTRRTYW